MDKIIASIGLRGRPLSWIILLGTLIVFGTVGLTLILLWDSRTDTQQAADRDALNIVATLEKDIVRNIELFDLSIQGVALTIQDPTIATLTGRARQLAIFDQAATATYFNALLVLDADGHIVEDSTSHTPRDGVFADRDYFSIHKEHDKVGLYISRPFRSRLSVDGSIIVLSRRITRPDGSFGGVVAGAIRTAYFQNLIEGLSVGPHGTVAVSRTDGALIARLPLLPAGVERDFQTANVFKHFPVEQSGRFEAISTTDGVSRRLTFRGVKNLPLLIAVGFADDDIYGAWKRKALGSSAVTLALLSAMAGLAFLLFKEMTRRKLSEDMLRDSETRYRLIADSSNDAIVLRDASGRRTYASPSYFALIGRSADELGARSIFDFIKPEARAATKDTYRLLRDGQKGVVTCFECDRPDGSVVWLESISNAIFDKNGDLSEVVTNIRDVTARNQLEAELSKAATIDGLTGLTNRRSFDQIFSREWRRAARDGSGISMIMIDVDFFKSLNDTYGHVEGDKALKRIASIIEANIRRPGDLVARYGGEEFVVVLPATNPAGALFVAEQVRRAVRTATIPNFGGKLGIVTVSLGVATMMPKPGADGTALIKAADAALYDAKLSGRNRCRVADIRDETELRHSA